MEKSTCVTLNIIQEVTQSPTNELCCLVPCLFLPIRVDDIDGQSFIRKLM